MRIKDNSPIPEKYRARCAEIQELVNRGQCSLIDLMGRANPEDRGSPEIFSAGALRTKNLIGVFEYREKENGPVEQIIIGDRFGPDAAANSGEFLSPFSWAMLELCLDETPLWLLNEGRTNGNTDIFDQILLLQLATQLDRAWKKGRFRVYRTVSHYDSRVRGQLDLPRQIRMSMGLDDGCAAYRTREFSEDNPYNQLFLQACLAAEKRQPGWMRNLGQKMPGFRQARKALEQQSFGWERTDTRSLLNHTRKRIANPVCREYETLRRIARAVLKRASHTGYAGGGASFVTGIFLDVSKLWEDYLAKAVLSPLQPQEQHSSDILYNRSVPLLTVRPDFWWKEKPWVLDAKYRPVWGEALKAVQAGKRPDQEKRGWIQDNVYQVLSYMLALDCTHGGVIFPVQGRRPGPASARVFSVVDRHFGLIPFYVPQSGGESLAGAMEEEAAAVCEELTAFFQPA